MSKHPSCRYECFFSGLFTHCHFSNCLLHFGQTLGILLDKGGVSLKAFAPQLQTTFVKALSDPSKQTRSKAVHALGKLMIISARVDVLLTELCGLCTSAESNAIRCSAIDALSVVLEKGGSASTAPVLEKVRQVIFNHLIEDDELLRQASSVCCGKLSAYQDSIGVGDFILDLADLKALKSEAIHCVVGRILSIGAIMQHSGKKLDAIRGDAFDFLKAAFKDERQAAVTACCSALVAAFTLPTHAGAVERSDEYVNCITQTFAEFAKDICANASKDKSEDCRRLCMTALKLASTANGEMCRTHARLILPIIIESWRDINLRVKSIADRLFYNMSEGAAANHISTFSSLLSGDDSAYLRSYAKQIQRMPKAEEEEECW